MDMLAARLTAACLAVLALAPAAGAMSSRSSALTAPTGLHAFLLRADEPTETSFARTPAFAWNPVRGALRYQFQLATSPSFRENAIVYQAKSLTTPVAAPTATLPWTNDMFHARVRAVVGSTVTPWSRAFHFDMDPPAAPTPLSGYPGLLRWTPVEGADGYDVWLVDANKFERVFTNVLDEREFFTFHRASSWTGTVRWRIRAIRIDRNGSERQNGIPAVGYGPWSPVYSSGNSAYTGGPIRLLGTISDVVSPVDAQRAHRLMPAFAFSGDQSLDGTSAELFRVYVFTDRQCINRVFTGAVVGGPAYAPRPYGPLALPLVPSTLAAARASYLADGTEPSAFTYDGETVHANESKSPATPTTAIPADSDADPTSGATGGSGTTSPTNVTTSDDLGAPVDLWDTEDRGGYWWTVVPVQAIVPDALATNLSSAAPSAANSIPVVNTNGFAIGDIVDIGSGPSLESATVTAVSPTTLTLASGLKFAHGVGEPVLRSGGNLQYRDLELAQDACAAGRVARLAKNSEPGLTAAGDLFASGLSSSGKLISAQRTSAFYGNPLVAWTPAFGASVYEVQWSKTRSPFKPQPNPQNSGALGAMTLGTAAVLPLAPGTWYYRVRGFNYSLPTNAQQMSWSDPARIVVAKPKFAVVGTGKTKK